jgi:hypothetical protein
MKKHEFIIQLISNRYDINLCTPFKKRKEALDVCAYMLKTHTDMKHVAIALTLGSTARSTNLIASSNAVKRRRKTDEEFDIKLSNIDSAIKQMFMYDKS